MQGWLGVLLVPTQACVLQMTPHHLPAEPGWCCGSHERFLSHGRCVFCIFFFSSSIRKETCVSISRAAVCRQDLELSPESQAYSVSSVTQQLQTFIDEGHLELIVPAVEGHRPILDNQHIISITQTVMWTDVSLVAQLLPPSTDSRCLCLFFCFPHSDPLVLIGRLQCRRLSPVTAEEMDKCSFTHAVAIRNQLFSQNE